MLVALSLRLAAWGLRLVNYSSLSLELEAWRLLLVASGLRPGPGRTLSPTSTVF